MTLIVILIFQYQGPSYQVLYLGFMKWFHSYIVHRQTTIAQMTKNIAYPFC